ncbi:MAG: amidohydrolase [Synergistaceae bacterium]|jgi:imidazolonepropionase-like amidohydrolase|nr:amidohydrolase [Synergistaceae bacterium]
MNDRSVKFLKGAYVFDGTGKVFGSASIIIEGHKIAGVGEDIAAPDGAETINLEGLTVTPGLIDAHVHMGLCNEGFPEDMDDTNDMVDPVAPQLRVLDALYPDDVAFREALAGGVTCVQSLPGSGNVIGGQGAIVKTKPDVIEKMIVRAPSTMKAALGENPVRVYTPKNKLPNTRMGSAFLMRDAFVRAQNYANKHLAFIRKNEAAERDLGMEAIVMVLDGLIPFSVHCHRSDDIQTAVRVAEEFGVGYTIEHCTEGHLIADWLAAHGARVSVGPSLTSKPKLELRNKTWDTPVKLWKAGVHFCIITDHPVVPIEHLSVCASLAVRAGLPPEEALKAVTIYAAEHLNIQDRVGSIEPGKDADIAVWDGDPLDSRSKVLLTFVGGELFFER